MPEEPEEKKDEEGKKEEKEEAKKEEKKKPAQDKKADQKAAGQDDDALDAVVKLMTEQKFDKAASELKKMLRKQPEDPVVLHNLGAVLTEQCKWEEAEEVFYKAFDAQKKKNEVNYATLFGLATVLTEQGGTGKLMQGEALFRDYLDKAISQEEHGVFETYRGFTSLAENLGLQKRWAEAAEAYEQSLALGMRMFGETNNRNLAQAALLERAKRLARMQKYMRIGLWTATAAVPVFCVWMWNYVGGPSLREMLGWGPEASNATAPDGASAAASHGGEL